MRRRRPVVEDVTDVTAATPAMDFRAFFDQRIIGLRPNGGSAKRSKTTASLPRGRTSGRRREEERQVAARAVVRAASILFVQRTSENGGSVPPRAVESRSGSAPSNARHCASVCITSYSLGDATPRRVSANAATAPANVATKAARFIIWSSVSRGMPHRRSFQNTAGGTLSAGQNFRRRNDLRGDRFGKPR